MGRWRASVMKKSPKWMLDCNLWRVWDCAAPLTRFSWARQIVRAYLLRSRGSSKSLSRLYLEWYRQGREASFLALITSVPNAVCALSRLYLPRTQTLLFRANGARVEQKSWYPLEVLLSPMCLMDRNLKTLVFHQWTMRLTVLLGEMPSFDCERCKKDRISNVLSFTKMRPMGFI